MVYLVETYIHLVHMADFNELEAVDGLRMTWNVWPNSKIEAAKCTIPFGALYTPTKALANLMVRMHDN